MLRRLKLIQRLQKRRKIEQELMEQLRRMMDLELTLRLDRRSKMRVMNLMKLETKRPSQFLKKLKRLKLRNREEQMPNKMPSWQKIKQ